MGLNDGREGGRVGGWGQGWKLADVQTEKVSSVCQ